MLVKSGGINHERSRQNAILSLRVFTIYLYIMFFFNSYESFSIVKEGAFGKMDCKEALESYFKIKL